MSVTTTCPTCRRAPLVQRVYLAVGAQAGPPLFAETYECGAVRLYGLIEGDGVARSCPRTTLRVIEGDGVARSCPRTTLREAVTREGDNNEEAFDGPTLSEVAAVMVLTEAGHTYYCAARQVWGGVGRASAGSLRATMSSEQRTMTGEACRKTQ